MDENRIQLTKNDEIEYNFTKFFKFSTNTGLIHWSKIPEFFSSVFICIEIHEKASEAKMENGMNMKKVNMEWYNTDRVNEKREITHERAIKIESRNK